MIKIKRIYDAPSPQDGYRVLVDRLWPRGISKDKAALDEWLKDIAPSTDLRKWFDHKLDRFEEFSVRYTDELLHNPAVSALKKLITNKTNVTLLYAARDPQINHAKVLQEFLERNNN